MKRLAAWLLLAGLGFCRVAQGEPKVQVTGTAPRGDITLTIYHPQLTLVQDRRTLSLHRGLNEYRVSWAGVNLDRDTVRLEPQPGVKGISLRDAVYVDENPNTVIWHIEAARADAYPVSISYHVSGLSWWADHVLTVDDREKTVSLQTWANVANSSGEDYRDAQIRLVMGEVRTVGGVVRKAAAGGARGPRPALAAAEEAEVETAAFEREGYSEYTFYTLARREDLDDGSTRKIPLAAANAIPLKKLYAYATDMYGPGVAMLYLFDNKPELGLGPLPPGTLRAYRQEADGRLTLVGEDSLGYLPVGETARIFLGKARDVIVTVNQTGYRRTDEEYAKDRERLLSYVERAEYTVEVKNRKTEPIRLLVRQHLPSPDTELVEATPKASSPQVGVLEWELSVGAGKTARIVYRTKRKVFV